MIKVQITSEGNQDMNTLFIKRIKNTRYDSGFKTKARHMYLLNIPVPTEFDGRFFLLLNSVATNHHKAMAGDYTVALNMPEKLKF